MQLYDSFGPNPRAMRMFLAEKGITIPKKDVDLMGAENRKPPYTDRDPGWAIAGARTRQRQVYRRDGRDLQASKEKHPTPALIGTTAEERAYARNGSGESEWQITEHLYNGFRYAEGAELFKARMRILPEASAGLKAIVQDKLKRADGQLEGKEYIAGNRFTVADIILYCALDFGGSVGQKIDPSLKNVNAWFKRVESRPSANSSLHPGSAQTGMKG